MVVLASRLTAKFARAGVATVHAEREKSRDTQTMAQDLADAIVIAADKMKRKEERKEYAIIFENWNGVGYEHYWTVQTDELLESNAGNGLCGYAVALNRVGKNGYHTREKGLEFAFDLGSGPHKRIGKMMVFSKTTATMEKE